MNEFDCFEGISMEFWNKVIGYNFIFIKVIIYRFSGYTCKVP